MKYKTIVSVLIVLLLVTTVVYAKNVKDMDKIKATEDKLSETSEISTKEYSDLWAVTSSDDSIVSASGSYTDIKGMIYVITLKRPSTVVVLFSSEMKTPDGILSVMATIDDKTMLPGSVWFAENTEGWESHSFNFKRGYVPAGRHEIKIQAYKYGSDAVLLFKSMIIIANGYGH